LALLRESVTKKKGFLTWKD